MALESVRVSKTTTRVCVGMGVQKSGKELSIHQAEFSSFCFLFCLAQNKLVVAGQGKADRPHEMSGTTLCGKQATLPLSSTLPANGGFFFKHVKGTSFGVLFKTECTRSSVVKTNGSVCRENRRARGKPQGHFVAPANRVNKVNPVCLSPLTMCVLFLAPRSHTIKARSSGLCKDSNALLCGYANAQQGSRRSKGRVWTKTVYYLLDC